MRRPFLASQISFNIKVVIDGSVLNEAEQLVIALDEREHVGRDLAKLVDEREWRDVPLCPPSSNVDHLAQTKIGSFFVKK